MAAGTSAGQSRGFRSHRYLPPTGQGIHRIKLKPNEQTKRRAPAFQFYADDFLAGTLDLSQADVGAYIRLLCHQWNRGSIPVENEKQQRLAGGSISVDVLAKFRLLPDGRLVNERLEVERQKQSEYRELQSLKGKLSAEARKNQPDLNRGSTAVQPTHQPDGQPDTQPKSNSPSPSPSPTSTSIPSTDERGRKVNRFAPPTRDQLLLEAAKVGLPEDEVDKFLAHYGSNGWRVGKNPMKSWSHALAGWTVRWRTYPQRGSHSQTLFGTSTPADAAF